LYCVLLTLKGSEGDTPLYDVPPTDYIPKFVLPLIVGSIGLITNVLTFVLLIFACCYLPSSDKVSNTFTMFEIKRAFTLSDSC
jgi:hypothetical protein